ncbi:tetratricopeptide repeat protein [Agriterribacter sp.]|uniref:tetratricopeptide repeat protein n=1 Tax=Agriterribacter sp. TaxID=2821509 RepID=UPI002B8E4FE6|nr:tetratricopeptide repeat protein [Agriterribacter sp.]HRO47299.1 tetratricopeptide repeat protein [Agriterribacter sp.]HRQ19301.1 tetratricopeptide repeat protein [Agriterribacter sp.]
MQGRFIYITMALLCISAAATAQQTRIYTDPQAGFNQAKEYFQKEQYSLAYPLFKEMRNGMRSADRSNNNITYDDVQFYTIACGLQQNETFAAEEAKGFIVLNYNPSLTQRLSFHLAEYYFRKNDMREALAYYEQTSAESLSNRQVADMKFHQGYAYFTLEEFSKASPLLESIAKTTSDPNYKAANYYYGLIAYANRNYREGLTAFRKVEKDDPYKNVVPFYVANIYYVQGQKEEALAYGESALGKTGGYYDVPMKELIGHAWFEKGDYAKALPYLEDYVNKTEKVNRETLYQLSYCYYQAKQLNKAVEGLKQLSGGEDSLSQNAMYILGDAYLKLGDKANARNAFSFCAANNTNPAQREVSKFNYAKLSYELGFQDIALNEFKKFLDEYPNSIYQKEAAEIAAALLANTNNYREALSILEKIPSPAESVKRMYPRVLYGRAMELINDQDLNAAKAVLDKALRDPFNAPVLPLINFWEGEIAYRQNRLDEAMLFYNDYLRNPSYSGGEVSVINARYNLGYCYYRKENYRQASTFFEQVSKNPPLNARPVEQDAYLRLADCYYMNKDFSKARSIYNAIINYSWPSGDYATYQNAMIAGVNSSNEKINLMKTIERKYPSSLLTPDVNLEIAKTYLADEKYRDAVPYLNNVLSAPVAGNLKPGAQLKLGLAYLNLNNNTEALTQFRKLVADYPNTVEANEAIENVKSIYTAEGKTEEYVAFMRSAGRSVTINEEDNLTYRAAENRYIDKDFNGALTALNNYLTKFPDGQNALDAWFLRTEIYNQQKDWKNAVAGYSEVSDRGASKYAERAASQAGRIYYFELQDYPKAEQYFTTLKMLAAGGENRLEAMRGLLRSQYQQKKWAEAVGNAQELLKEKNTGVDDKVLAYMVSARADQDKGAFTEAIRNFRNVVSINKASFAAEARYEIASSYYSLNDLKNADKAAFETINKSGSYDFWITRAYILLGDIYFKEKDYFNAKATLQSVVDNSRITELKNEAAEKLKTVINAERTESKIAG